MRALSTSTVGIPVICAALGFSLQSPAASASPNAACNSPANYVVAADLATCAPLDTSWDFRIALDHFLGDNAGRDRNSVAVKGQPGYEAEFNANPSGPPLVQVGRIANKFGEDADQAFETKRLTPISGEFLPF